MKVSHVLLLALVALLGVSAFAMDLEAEREVRSYTSDMEYVDHVEHNMNDASSSNDESSMMETAAGSESEQHDLGADDHGMHFEMEAEDEVASFLEQDSEELNTDVMRAMALEIHDAAQANIDEEGEVLMMETAASADPNLGLTPAEIAQEAADNAAEKKDAAQEIKDKVEEKVEAVEAKKDEKILAQPTPVVPTAAPAAPAAAPAKKDVVVLPKDLSAEHAETLRANRAATKTIQGALKEMGSILQSKDDTIRSLVFNISYLTVNIGKLANKVDLQQSYISLLRQKLRLSRSKVQQLKSHVRHSSVTAKSIRAQLQAVEARLNKQDAKTEKVSTFLKKNADKIRLPKLADDLEIRGRPVKKAGKKGSNKARKLRKAIRKASKANSRLRPVEGTQTFADAHSIPFIPASPQFYPASQYFVNAAIPTPLTHPTFSPYDGIPTIVVERQDDGQ